MAKALALLVKASQGTVPDRVRVGLPPGILASLTQVNEMIVSMNTGTPNYHSPFSYLMLGRSTVGLLEVVPTKQDLDKLLAALRNLKFHRTL